MGVSQRLCPPGVSHPQASPHSASNNSSKLPFKCFYYLLALVAFVPGKQILAVTLWIHPSLRFQGGNLPCKLSSLLCPRKVMDFQFVQLFSYCKNSDDFQALYMSELKLKVLELLFYVNVFGFLISPSQFLTTWVLVKTGTKLSY